jgi:hypothetical protein
MGSRVPLRSIKPAVIASALVFALIAALVITVFSAMSKIGEAKSMLRNLEEPWRAIWLESSRTGPGAAGSGAPALGKDLASFEAGSADPKIRYLCKASPDFTVEFSALRARVSAIALTASGGGVLSAEAALALEASFGKLASIVDSLASREIRAPRLLRCRSVALDPR